MRYHRLKRRFAIGIICCITLWMLSGCSDKKVDYDSNISQNNAEVEEGGEKEKSSSLEQFKQAETWHDDLSLEPGEGRKINFGIDANIIVPDTDTMSVVEVESIPVDAAFKEKVLSAFFEGTDIYYHDEAHYTKEELEKLIAQQEEFVASIRESAEKEAEYGLSGGADSSAEYLDMMEEKLQNYRKLLETAKEDYTLAEEFESCSEYLGYRNDMLCRADFTDNDYRYNSISIFPQLYNGPEELKKNDFQYPQWETGKTEEKLGKESGENQCSFSMEEAQKVAEQFLSQIGLSSLVCTKADNLYWMGYDEDSEDSEQNSNSSGEYVPYGYYFEFEVAVAGNSLGGEKAISGSDVTGGLNNVITVTDDGIIEVYLHYLVNVTNITNQVELLPLSTIQKIIKNELSEHPDTYHITQSSHAGTLELMYLRVQDENNEGSYSYIPVWRLSDALHSYSPVMVNAIDGSVIYLENGWELEAE